MERIAIWQTGSLAGDPEGNIARLAFALAKAKAQGAELLVTPELWLTGYNWPDQISACAQAQGGPAAKQLAALARQNRIAIAYGYPEREKQTAKLFNSVQLIDANGAMASHYRKIHLYGPMEKALFRPGDHFTPPVMVGGVKIAMLVCYDIEFPESARRLALEGAELILVPTALSGTGDFVPRFLVPARAIENLCHIAYVNHCGIEGDLTYCGASGLFGPEGPVEMAAQEESLLVARIDPTATIRATAQVPYFADRRAALYSE